MLSRVLLSQAPQPRATHPVMRHFAGCLSRCVLPPAVRAVFVVWFGGTRHRCQHHHGNSSSSSATTRVYVRRSRDTQTPFHSAPTGIFLVYLSLSPRPPPPFSTQLGYRFHAAPRDVASLNGFAPSSGVLCGPPCFPLSTRFEKRMPGTSTAALTQTVTVSGAVRAWSHKFSLLETQSPCEWCWAHSYVGARAASNCTPSGRPLSDECPPLLLHTAVGCSAAGSFAVVFFVSVLWDFSLCTGFHPVRSKNITKDTEARCCAPKNSAAQPATLPPPQFACCSVSFRVTRSAVDVVCGARKKEKHTRDKNRERPPPPSPKSISARNRSSPQASERARGGRDKQTQPKCSACTCQHHSRHTEAKPAVGGSVWLCAQWVIVLLRSLVGVLHV